MYIVHNNRIVYMHMCVYVFMCLYMYMCIYAYIYVCIYDDCIIYIYMHVYHTATLMHCTAPTRLDSTRVWSDIASSFFLTSSLPHSHITCLYPPSSTECLMHIIYGMSE